MCFAQKTSVVKHRAASGGFFQDKKVSNKNNNPSKAPQQFLYESIMTPFGSLLDLHWISIGSQLDLHWIAIGSPLDPLDLYWVTFCSLLDLYWISIGFPIGSPFGSPLNLHWISIGSLLDI